MLYRKKRLFMDKTHYFYRTVIFTRKDGIALVDIDQAENTTPLEKWFGTVVSLADGQHTIKEMMEYVSKKYQDVPDNLEKTIDSVIERLIGGNIIRLSEKAVTLPYYLASPIEDLDIEKAKKLIQEDEKKQKSQ